jgi:hypothetical protein
MTDRVTPVSGVEDEEPGDRTGRWPIDDGQEDNAELGEEEKNEE